MERYKDFSYVQYILNLEFKQGFILYMECLEANKNINIEKSKDRVFQLWLIEIQNGYEGTFDEYYKAKERASFDKPKNADEEEKRILDKIKNRKNKKVIERVIV